jgi:energy-coupling factor transport system permease protein
VKLAWLLSFLAAPIMANSPYRVALVVLLILITLAAGIPWRVWRQQMGWLLLLSFFVMLLGAVSPDGLGVDPQPRLPTAQDGQLLVLGNEFDAGVGSREDKGTRGQGELGVPTEWGLGVKGTRGNSDSHFPTPHTPQRQLLQRGKNEQRTGSPTPLSDYQYVLFQYWIITVTRRSVELALRLSTSLFTLIYSTNLYLLTAAPEEITAGLESLMLPLRRLRLPVTEIALTLTLSLRFIPLVMEEVQNLIRSVRTRAINWKKLGVKGALRVWMIVAERLLENLLLRAEQMAKAMMVRGFTSPNTHRVQWHQLRFTTGDWIALVFLAVFWGLRLIWGNEV